MVGPCRSSSRCRLHHPSARGSGGHLRGIVRWRARWEWSFRSTRSFIAATPSSQTSTTSASIRTGSRSICSSSRTRISTTGSRTTDARRRPAGPVHRWPRIGIHFSDGRAAGREATLFHGGHLNVAKDDRGIPTEPILTMTGGGGGSHGWDFSVWVFPLPPTDLLRCMWRSRLLMLASRRSSSTVDSCALRPPGRGSSGADGHHAWPWAIAARAGDGDRTGIIRLGTAQADARWGAGVRFQVGCTALSDLCRTRCVARSWPDTDVGRSRGI
jgi:hypothetical protein